MVVVNPPTAEANSRTLSLYFTHTKESIKVVYKRNGRFVPSALRDLNRFLRDWRRNEATKMDRELFDLLWEVQQEHGGRTIHIVSAYRSPATNQMLRRRSRGVARNSQHMAGKAIDFFIPGANTAKVRISGMKRQVGGVGYYPRSRSPFVHFDTGRVRSWPRMSRSQLAKVFPDGKTLHLPRNGKPLKRYAEAQAAERAGRLQRLDGSAGRSRFAFLGGSRRTASDPSAGGTVDSGVIRPGTAPARPAPSAPARRDEPARVRTASVTQAPTPEAAAEESRSGILSQLPSVSLGGLINRFSDDDEKEAPQVRPVDPPAAPLTAVAVENPADVTAEPAPTAPASAAAPVPRQAPRAADAPAEGNDTPQDETITLAALPPQRPVGPAGTATDASPVRLGYARDDDGALQPASPLSATAALIPRTASLAPAGRNLLPSVTRAAVVQDANAMFTPVQGASAALIADSGSVSDATFAAFTAPDRATSAREGVLMAKGFLGAPSGFGTGREFLDTESFTGLKITVYAQPRS